MTWKAYQVAFRLLSPLHSGWRKLGNLQQTRPYVTGRSLWGALTARLTRERGSSDYEGIGKLVDDQLAFTYFYPSAQPHQVDLWPWLDTWDEFAWTFLGSYASTALTDGHYAEAGSLHETEFIAPYVRHENSEGVYLIGYIFEREHCSLGDWQGALNKLQFGGERSYGWGRVRIEGIREHSSDSKCFCRYEIACEGSRPHITVPEEAKLLAHTIAIDTTAIEGTIEPFLGRETRNHAGFGDFLPRPEICWTPGSKVTSNKTFQIGSKGVWEQSTIP
jgi:hypothetical protein